MKITIFWIKKYISFIKAFRGELSESFSVLVESLKKPYQQIAGDTCFTGLQLHKHRVTVDFKKQ